MYLSGTYLSGGAIGLGRLTQAVFRGIFDHNSQHILLTQKQIFNIIAR